MAQPRPALPSAAVWLLAVIALILTIAALRYAQSLMAPVALGLVCAVVLGPIVTRLGRLGVPNALSATGALLIAGAALVLIVSALGPVVSKLMAQVPKIEREIQWWLKKVSLTLRGGLGDDIEKSISEGGEEAVKQAVPGLIDALWIAPNFMAQVMIFAGTLFFFLLTRDEMYARAPQLAQNLRRADRAVSHYFTTVTAINAGLGFAVFAAMTLIGLPNPMLWGAAAFALNFILYLGPIVMIGALLVAGLTQFSGAQAFLPPLVFLGLNLMEAQFITPALVGQRLRINPLGVFLAILFGLWLWGPIGGIVALPALVWAGAFFSRFGVSPMHPEEHGVNSAPATQGGGSG